MKKAVAYLFHPGKVFGLIVLLMLCQETKAQFDPTFTQYMNNEMYINPAYTGTRKALAITMLYRNQWVGLDGAPKTQTFSIHAPMNIHNGLGLSLINETIGIMHQFRANGNYSYRMQTGEETQLSFGIQGGIVRLQENYNALTLIDQDDRIFTASKENIIAPNAGFGMFLYTKKWYVGLSIPRMIKNRLKTNDNSRLENTASPGDWHYYLTSAYVFDLSEEVKMKPSTMIKYVKGAPMQAELSLQTLFSDVWWIGASYRSGDALSAITGFQITNQLRMFYSYDYSLTPLKGYNSGTHEITLGYDFAFKKHKIASPRLF